MRSRPGFTLVEVIIAAALLVVLMGAFLQLMSSQAGVASEESQDTSAQTGLIATLEAMLPLLEEAKLIEGEETQVIFSPRRLRFHVPLKDVQGRLQVRESAVSGTMEVLLGAGQPGTMSLGHYFELAFQPAYDPVTFAGRPDQLVREADVLRSSGLTGVDLNQNGTLSDSFMFGSMVLRHYDDKAVLVAERALEGRVAVLWPDGRIFSVNNTQLTVSLTALDLRTRGEESRIRSTSTMVRLRGLGVTK